MCGFFGLFSKKHRDIQSKYRLSRSIASIQARGGDRDEWFNNGDLSIFHSRLCIQGDLQTGRQPYVFDNFVMVFNGNITNFKALAKSNRLMCLKKKIFSDTEVIAELFQKFGENCFKLLNGFYSICIYDVSKKCFTMASDRTGQKPLYWYLCDDTFIFSSTLEIFYENNFRVDNTSLIDFFQYGFVPKPKTIFSGVKSISPGTVVKIEFSPSGSRSNEWQYWDFDFANTFKQRHDIREFNELLSEVVRDNMTANQEVATLFSGGVDSSLIAFNVAREKANSPLLTLSFPGDDTLIRTSEILREITDVKHMVITPSVDSTTNLLDKLSTIADSPFEDTSIIPSFQIFEAGKNAGYNVFLTGDGADELFLGYNYFQRFQKFLKLKAHMPTKMIDLLLKSYSLVKNQDKHNSFYAASDPDNLILRIFETGFDIRLIENELANNYEVTEHLNQVLLQVSELSDYEKLRYLSVKFKLPNQMLYKVDRASGTNSCEARPIYLDNRIIDYATGLSHQQHLQLGGKGILKDLYKLYFKNEAYKMPKTGFGIKSENYDWILDNKSKDTLSKKFDFNITNLLDSRAKNAKKGLFSLRSLSSILEKIELESC